MIICVLINYCFPLPQGGKMRIGKAAPRDPKAANDDAKEVRPTALHCTAGIHLDRRIVFVYHAVHMRVQGPFLCSSCSLISAFPPTPSSKPPTSLHQSPPLSYNAIYIIFYSYFVYPIYNILCYINMHIQILFNYMNIHKASIFHSYHIQFLLK